MRICYIDHYAGSPTLGMEYRPHALARRWRAQGHEVTLLAASFSHLRQNNPVVEAEGEPIEIDGVTFRFIRTRKYVGNGLGRILSWVDFVGKGFLNARRIANALQPDVVIASSTYPMDTWLANRIARISHAKLVHEVHDLWPLTPMELGGHSAKHPLMWLMARAERSAYNNSSVIISILPNIQPHVRSLGIDTPVVHVPNGIEPTVSGESAPAELEELIERLHERGRKVVGYAGGMATSNAMDDFVAAMGLLTDEPITAVLIGDGVLRPELEAQARLLGCHIEFFGSIPKSQVHDSLTRMDALYIGSKRSRLYEYGVSANKIFDYLLTGVPVINAFATEHSPLVAAGCTITATAEDPSSIANAIRQAASLPGIMATKLGSQGKSYVLRHHDLDALAQDFLDAISH